METTPSVTMNSDVHAVWALLTAWALTTLQQGCDPNEIVPVGCVKRTKTSVKPKGFEAQSIERRAKSSSHEIRHSGESRNPRTKHPVMVVRAVDPGSEYP
jgi:hypothetical protein